MEEFVLLIFMFVLFLSTIITARVIITGIDDSQYPNGFIVIPICALLWAVFYVYLI